MIELSLMKCILGTNNAYSSLSYAIQHFVPRHSYLTVELITEAWEAIYAV